MHSAFLSIRIKASAGGCKSRTRTARERVEDDYMNNSPIDASSSHREPIVSRDRTPLLIAAAFAIVHIGLVIFIDASNAEVFLRADRAQVRLRTLLELLASPSFDEAVHYLASHGIVGDYAAHALLYAVGGRFFLIGVQIALCLIAGLCVYRLGRALELSGRMSAMAMTVYLCMPHTLVFPHQLASEALHVPLLVISTWLLAKGILERQWRVLAISALLLGIATLIRPITLLWPLVAGIVAAIALRPRLALAYTGLAVLPIVLWMSFIGMNTGEFGLGKSDHSMERNLYERVGRITDSLPSAEQENARREHLSSPERTLGASDYLRFSFAYPVASLRHLMHDATAFFAKSGVERITIDYLQLTPDASRLQGSRDGWRQQLERHGWAYTLRFLWDTLGPILLVSAFGAVAIVALFILAAIGAAYFVRQLVIARTPESFIGTMLLGLVAYIFLFSQVLNAMQSRQRAPAEFAVALLAAAGLQWLRSRSRQRAPYSPARVTKSGLVGAD